MARSFTIEEIFDRNPAYVELYRAAIEAASGEEPAPRAEVCAAVDAARCSASQIQSAPSVVDALVRCGALTESVTVDGEPYEGTLRDVQEDEEVSEDAQIERFHKATEEGLSALQSSDPGKRIAGLVDEKPHRAAGFTIVVDLCDGTPRTTREIQEALRAAGALDLDPRTGMELVHASYFTGALEKAGALEWRDSRWVTTPAGRKAFA